MSKQDTEPVENVMNEEEEEDVEQLTEEQKRQMEMEQEAKLKQTHGAEALQVSILLREMLVCSYHCNHHHHRVIGGI